VRSSVLQSTIAVREDRVRGPVPAAAAPWLQAASDFVALVKPRIMVLLLITTLAAVLIAATTRHIAHIEILRLVLFTMVGGALAAGGASALNQYIDRDIDCLMSRTRNRPLPGGRMQPRTVLWFGIALSVLSVVVFTFGVNLLSAMLALSGNLFYVIIYTIWLKRTTPQNIVIGGIAGAIPPLVGWAAVCDNVSLPALLLFVIITLWTPPHFWSLSLMTERDYSRAGIPMLPVVRGLDKTRLNIVVYTGVLVSFTLALFATHVMGLFYLGAAVLLGAYFLFRALILMRRGTMKMARMCFVYSNIYLALLFAAMVIDRLLALS